MLNKRSYLLLIFLICSLTIAFKLRQIRSVNNRALTYTYNCGWVDWTHAKSASIQRFIKAFNQQYDSTALNASFEITYLQNGGYKINGFPLLLYSTGRKYKVLKSSEDELLRKQLLFKVFEEVSFQFEERQATVFWGNLKTSSFAEGDLMGSLIGFYIAEGKLTEAEARCLAKIESFEVSEVLKADGKLGTNKTFQPIFRLKNDEPPVFPKLLETYTILAASPHSANLTVLETINTLTFFGQEWAQ